MMSPPLASESVLLQPGPSLLLLAPVLALVVLVVWREILPLRSTPAPQAQARVARLVRVLAPVVLLLLGARLLLIML